MPLIKPHRLVYDENNPRGYTMIDNEFLRGQITNEEGNPLSAKARYVLMCLLAYKDGWSFSWEQFQQATGVNKNWRETAVTELKEEGYFETVVDGRNGRENIYAFHVYQFPKNSEYKKFLYEEGEISAIGFSGGLKSDTLISGGWKIDTNNNIYNKTKNNKNNLNKKNAEINFRKDSSFNSSINLNKDNTCNHDNHETCLHDSTDTSTFSNKINKHEVNMAKNFVTGDINLNNSENAYGRKKSTATVKGIKHDGTPTKNKEELNAEKSKDSVGNILKNEQNAKPLAEQTKEEQEIGAAKKIQNETKEMLYEIKAKTAVRKNTRSSRTAKIFGIIEKEETVLQDSLKNFFSYVIETGKPVLEVNYRSFRRKLDSLASDDKSKIAIIEQSLSNCWTDIYPLKDYDKFKKEDKPISVAKTEDEEVDCSALWLDENGNPVKM